jgi:hypothetical protein
MARGVPFKKGDSRINRKGRPKMGTSLAGLCRDALLEVLDPVTGYRRIDSVLDKMVIQAQQGNKDARNELLTRAFGKPVERIEQTNVNQNYDFSNLSMEERLKLLEQLKIARATVVRDDPDKL